MDIPVILVIAAVVGALFNVVRGLANAPATGTPPKVQLDLKQVLAGIVIAVMASLAAVQALDITHLVTQGPITLALVGLATGFGSDFAITNWKNGGS